MTPQEHKRHQELEERPDFNNLTPEEKAEYKELSEKFDRWWEKQSEKTSGENRAEEKAARTAALTSKAHEVADNLGFDKSRINMVEGTRHFEVNGIPHVAGGDADIAKGALGRIRLYVDHLNVDSVVAVTAHEVEHFKFQAAIDAYRKDSEAIRSDPGPAPDPNHERWWGKKGGIDAIMSPDGSLKAPADKKYPFYQAMHEALYGPSVQDFAKGDGVSGYSAEYWKAYHAGKVGYNIAMHETLAGMAKTKYMTGSFPDHYGYSRMIRERNKSRPTPEGEELRADADNKVEGQRIWRNLYRVVEQIHKGRIRTA